MKDTTNRPVVVMETEAGKITIELFPEVAPKACENFIGLAEAGKYDRVIFHRVISGFMIQGGDPTGTGRAGSSIWGKPFADECQKDVRFDEPWLLAMANSGPNTNGSQFFITTEKTPWLNGRHTIFGRVISGKDTVRKIEKTATDSEYNKPKEDQVILKVYLQKD